MKPERRTPPASFSFVLILNDFFLVRSSHHQGEEVSSRTTTGPTKLSLSQHCLEQERKMVEASLSAN
jgi:hypothetical protein